jgi:uncharacterized Ntn-hydrolase superfamily protein
MIELTFHTFSIVARCPRTGSFGVSVSTARPAVGAAVPWVSARGAVATQAKTNTELGRRALALLDQGASVRVALATLLVWSPEPRPYHNLRVDDHTDPVVELRRLHGLAVAHTDTLLEQYGADGLRRYRRPKG